MSRPKSPFWTATLFAATLFGLFGIWTSWIYVIDFEWLSGRADWGRGAVAVVPFLAGAATLAVLGLGVARHALPSSGLTTRWLVFLVMTISGYFVMRDGMTYNTYFSRPGGLPGGCYTDLEVWLRVSHDYSWVRALERAVGCALFFAAPLVLVVALRYPTSGGPTRAAARDGA
jgi:hypothetical protein